MLRRGALEVQFCSTVCKTSGMIFYCLSHWETEQISISCWIIVNFSIIDSLIADKIELVQQHAPQIFSF